MKKLMLALFTMAIATSCNMESGHAKKNNDHKAQENAAMNKAAEDKAAQPQEPAQIKEELKQDASNMKNQM